MVKVYGTIVRDTGAEILVTIAANKGVAPQVGLSGQVWFAKRQIKELPPEEGFDVFECQLTLAKFKADDQCKGRPGGPTPGKRRGRKGKGDQ